MLNVIAQRVCKYALQRGNGFASRIALPRAKYFAFGANMKPDFLRRKNIFPASTTKAVLDGFTLEISSPCEFRDKGFASVRRQDGAKVFGVVHDISVFELLILDILEWAPFRFHRRLKGQISNGSDGIIEDAWYYVACSPRAGLKTSLGYRKMLVDAASAFEFPVDYVELLQSLPVADRFNFDHGFRLSNPAKRRWLETEFQRAYRLHDELREQLCQRLP